jgi:gliding motility-associated-like protein
LQAVSSSGCINTDWVWVQVVDDIFIPTAFTPNNDGKNDHWRIPYLDPLAGTVVSVYNRYGQLVYQVKGGEVKWDGTVGGIPQAAGTYVYFLHFSDGSPDRKGTISLLR